MRERVSRAAQVELNHARLMQAARRVFVKRGYHAASLDEVASSAGFTKGVVYARFASKAEMMLALLEARIAERAAQMQELVAAMPRARDAVGPALARQWMEVTRPDTDWQLLVLEFRVHAARDRALNAKFRALHARMRDAIAAAYAGVPAIVPPDDLARIAMALTEGVALERAVDPDGFSAELFVRVADALTKGLRR
jgi:AcrR family transcriptional regulator